MMRLSIMAVLLVYSFVLFADDTDRLEIEQRIQPVGKVHIKEEPNTGTATQENQVTSETSKKEEAKKEPGQEIYEQYCIVCHKDGVAGAPKFRDAADWKPRWEGKTIEEIIAIATKGLNAMPPKGTCSECSDEDLKNAINYMQPK